MNPNPTTGSRKSAYVLRTAERSDLQGIWNCQRSAYSEISESSLCDLRHLGLQLDAFPEGQLVVTYQDQVVGYAMSLIVLIDDDTPWYSYAEITGNGTFSSHHPSGDTLYGADIAVHPDHRGKGIGRLLYEGRTGILRRFNLARMMAGGRIPGYRKHSGRMSAEEYVAEVESGRLHDPALSLHLAVGYRVRSVHHGYLRDEQSLDYATFLEMPNPEFHPERRRIAASPVKHPVRRVRVCAAQYEMRPIDGWDALESQVSFFVRTAQSYHCHFLVMPELFTAQLFTSFPPSEPVRDSMVRLAELADRYREMFSRFSRETGLYIAAGSHPVRVSGQLRNVAHLFSPTGEFYTQEKLHITAAERHEYGLSPGEGLRIFDTGLARVAMLSSYDLEFPELARLLTLAGAEVLLAPFSTDERRSYLRVRYCAHARAVENLVYVVLAGNVGNLPQVDNFLINYGHSAICTPSDFAFPTDGIAGLADIGGETVVIADLDLDALHQTRDIGSVRPLRDRRDDLYELLPRVEIKVVKTA